MARTVALTYNLRSGFLDAGLSDEDLAEFDSEETIEALVTAITSLGHRVVRIGDGTELCRRLVRGDRWDLVFNIAEGLHGRSREAQVPAILELYGIPYVFSDPLTCALTLDKYLSKTLVSADGIHTAAAVLIQHPADLAGLHLPFPLFAKPVSEGTGKGINHTNCTQSAAELEDVVIRLLTRYRQPVLVETYLPGREFTTGVLGTGNSARVLGTLEVKVKPEAPASVYSFQVKELCEQFVDYTPAPRDRTREAVEALALRAYRTLQCRDCGRVDVRLDTEGRPAFLEVNPLPGLHPTHSDLPMIATAEGMEYKQLIGEILQSAFARLEDHRGH